MDAEDGGKTEEINRDKHQLWFYWVFTPMFFLIGYAGGRGDQDQGILIIILSMLIFPVSFSYWILMPLCFKKSSMIDSVCHAFIFGLVFAVGLWSGPGPDEMAGMAVPFMPLLIVIIVSIGAFVLAVVRASTPAKEPLAGASAKTWMAVIIIPILVTVGWLYVDEGPFEDRGVFSRYLPEEQCKTNLRTIADSLPYILTPDIINDTKPGWCEYVQPMLSYSELKCPSAKGPCSYAINKNLLGVLSWESCCGPDIVVLFESKPGWNQIGGPELLESHGHFGKKGVYVYLTGSGVEYVEEKDIPKLKWIPENKP